MPGAIPNATVRIPNGTALSTSVRQFDGTFASTGLGVQGSFPLSIQMPAAWTAAVLTVQFSEDNANWFDAYDRNGAEITIQAAASRRIFLEPWILIGGTFIRFRSGTGAAAVNQGADRDLVLFWRDFS